MADISETRAQTIKLLLDGYSSLSVPTLLAVLSPRFKHRVLPASLEMPVHDVKSFADHAAGIFALFDAFRLVPEHAYEDDAQGVMVIHARMEGTLKNKGGPWRNECIMMVRLSDTGEEVDEICEFVDSAKAIEMRRKHAPKNFMVGGAGGGELARIGNVLLFAGLAAGAFFGVRRLLQ
ncbi:hypothetical protein B0T19DRAFT_416644 [Cercophora scortea]|uniref:SnoaL-like domain-containing protein n=1 Tax=Cercophora scortea TaxID=314031 RepID=A0AAE0IX10_9PEZI|nr:hypothetical protein B0T19DRAFT_416644 [Cercophora scortea]